MALMRLKNKYQVSFQKMLTKCRELDGYPDSIEVSMQEAYNILREIHVCCSIVKLKNTLTLRVDSNNGLNVTDIRISSLTSSSTLNEKMVNEMVHDWSQGTINVWFRHLPIKITSKGTDLPTETDLTE